MKLLSGLMNLISLGFGQIVLYQTGLMMRFMCSLKIIPDNGFITFFRQQLILERIGYEIR